MFTEASRPSETLSLALVQRSNVLRMTVKLAYYPLYKCYITMPFMFAYVKLILRILDLLWGPYTLGCLANFYNKKVAKYFSSFWNPGTSRGGRISPRLNQGQLLGSSSNLFNSRAPRVHLWLQRGSRQFFWPPIAKPYWVYIEDHRGITSGHALRRKRNSSSILGSSYAKGYVLFLKVNFGLTKEKQCLDTGLMTHSTHCSTIESWQ